MNFLRSLLFTLDGKVSKSKATALIGLLLTLLQITGIVELTDEQKQTAAAALLALWGIFIRVAVDEK